MSRFNQLTKNLAKRDERPSETRSRKGTIQEYEVEELDARPTARLLAKIRPGEGSRSVIGSIESSAD